LPRIPRSVSITVLVTRNWIDRRYRFTPKKNTSIPASGIPTSSTLRIIGTAGSGGVLRPKISSNPAITAPASSTATT
jgi:hypothetical protein